MTAPPRHPTVPPPAEPPPVAPSQAASVDLLQRIARAAGIPEQTIVGRDPDALADEIGLALRLMAQNLQILLSSRAESKTLMRSSSRTMIRSMQNNPLKFTGTVEEALTILLGPPTRQYLDLRSTIEESFRDLKTHQMLTYGAMQGALDALFDDLAPDQIDRSVATERGLGALVVPPLLWTAPRQRRHPPVVLAGAVDGDPAYRPADRVSPGSSAAAAAPHTPMISMICRAVMFGNSTEAVGATDSATRSATTVRANMVFLRPLTHGPSTARSLHSSSRYTVALGSRWPSQGLNALGRRPSGLPGISTMAAARRSARRRWRRTPWPAGTPRCSECLRPARRRYA